MVPAPVTFALVLSGLHASTLFATDAVFRWMFRSRVASRLQIDGGKPPKGEVLAGGVREVALCRRARSARRRPTSPLTKTGPPVLVRSGPGTDQ